MKPSTIGAFALLLFVPAFATAVSSDYFIRIGGVSGETTKTTRATTTVSGDSTVAAPEPIPQEAGTDYLLEIDGLKGESSAGTGSSAPEPKNVQAPEPDGATEAGYLKIGDIKGEATETSSKKGGKVDASWKVEEGTKAAAQPEPMLLNGDRSEPITPDFGILLGGDGDANDEAMQEARNKAAEVLLKSARDGGVPLETLALNFGKITAGIHHTVNLFGFIPVSAPTTVEITAMGEPRVQFPWWAFLASGKQSSELGNGVARSILDLYLGNQELVDGLLIIRY